MRSVRCRRSLGAAPSPTPRVLPGRGPRSAALLVALSLATPAVGQQKRPLTFTDLMQIRQIEDAAISRDGRWLAFTARPDRGDPEVVVRSTGGTPRYAVPFGSHPVISSDGVWVAVRANPSLEDRETAKKGEEPRPGMALLATRTGEVVTFDEVQAFAFSEDGRWLAYHSFAPRPADEEGGEEGEATAEARGEGGPEAEEPQAEMGERKRWETP